MIVDQVDIECETGDDVSLTHFHHDKRPPTVILAVSDGQRLALAEMTMAETNALKDHLLRMLRERGAEEDGVRPG